MVHLRELFHIVFDIIEKERKNSIFSLQFLQRLFAFIPFFFSGSEKNEEDKKLYEKTVIYFLKEYQNRYKKETKKDPRNLGEFIVREIIKYRQNDLNLFYNTLRLMHISGISKVIDLALVEKLKDIFVQSYSKIGINSSELEKKTYVVLLFITIEFFILSSKLKELHLFLTDLPPRYEAIETIMRFCLHFEQSLRIESREVKLTFDFFSEDKKFFIGGNEVKDKEELITNLLFDAITLYSKEQSNEDYNQFNMKKAYDLLFICLRKMLDCKNEVSKKMINANDHMFSTKIFLIAIKAYSSEPNVIDKIIKNNVLPISYLALTFYEKPFIFQLLLELNKIKDTQMKRST